MAITKVTNSLVSVNAIHGTLIADNAITSVHIAQNQVTSVQIPDSSITSTQLAANSVDTAELISGSIDAIHLASDSVTTAKILNANITTAKIANNAITSALIPDGSITDTQLGSGAFTMGNITTTGSIRGPASLTIDPATVGDNTGTVVIAGNLQVDGTTTTVNSTSVDIVDKNITLGKGGSASGNNGGGITIDGAAATLLYQHSDTSWQMNKPLGVTGNLSLSGDIYGTGNFDIRSTGNIYNTYGNSSSVFFRTQGGATKLTLDAAGDVTIADGIFTTIHDITTVNKFKTTNNNTRAAISMESKDSSGNAVDLRMHALGDGPRGEIFTFTNHPLAFSTNNAAPQMTLTTSGKLLIGTTSTTPGFSTASGIAFHDGDTSHISNASGAALILNRGGSDGSVLDIRKGGAQIGYIGTNSVAGDQLMDMYSQGLWRFMVNNDTEAMRMLANGNVGIDEDTPLAKLHVVGGRASGTMYNTAVFAGGQNSTSGSGARLYISGCENDPIARGTIIEGKMNDNGNSHELNFYTSGNSQAPAKRLTIDNAGRVRIGATLALNHLLNIQTASTSGLAQIEFRNTQAGTQIGMPANTNALSFFTADAERMRIDSSGNVGIGTTDTDLGYTDGDDGVLINPAGLVQVARDSAYAALYINKLNNTNGAMVDLHADGTKVGILSNLSGRMGIGSGDTGIFFDSTRDCISPFTMTGNDGRASAIDIGRTGVKFKDAHFSGNVFTAGESKYTNATTYRIAAMDFESTVTTGSTWTTVKDWKASQSGQFNTTWSAYIVSGSYYFNYRFYNATKGAVVKRSDNSTDASAYFNAHQTGNEGNVHHYQHYSLDLGKVDRGDVIQLQMVSADGSGNNSTGTGQASLVKNWRIFSGKTVAVERNNGVIERPQFYGVSTQTQQINTNGAAMHTVPVALDSGTHNIFSILSGFNNGTVAHASFEFTGLYAYAGANSSLGHMTTSIRRATNNSAWQVGAHTNHHESNGGTVSTPSFSWNTSGVLVCVVAGSVQLTGVIRITTRTVPNYKWGINI